MNLERYISYRYFFLLFSINLSITFLFNLIYIFEKFISNNNLHSSVLFSYFKFNLIPSFFDNISVSIWLATIFFLIITYENNEWLSFKIVNFNFYKIIKLFIRNIILIIFIIFIGKEFLSIKLLNKAEHLRLYKLKRQKSELIQDRWFKILYSNKTAFLYIGYLDTLSLKGKDLIFIRFRKNFEIKEKIFAKNFQILYKKDEIKLLDVKIIKTTDNIFRKVNKISLKITGLKKQLDIKNKVPRIDKLIKYIFIKDIPRDMRNSFLIDFLYRFKIYIEVLLLPLLILLSFQFFEFNKYYRWLFPIFTYPFLIFVSYLSSFIIASMWNIVFTIVLYLIFLVMIFHYTLRMKENY